MNDFIIVLLEMLSFIWYVVKCLGIISVVFLVLMYIDYKVYGGYDNEYQQIK